MATAGELSNSSIDGEVRDLMDIVLTTAMAGELSNSSTDMTVK